MISINHQSQSKVECLVLFETKLPKRSIALIYGKHMASYFIALRRYFVRPVALWHFVAVCVLLGIPAAVESFAVERTPLSRRVKIKALPCPRYHGMTLKSLLSSSENEKQSGLEQQLSRNPHASSRREAILQSFQATLLAVMAATGPSYAAANGEPQTILLTGASSGIGLEACKRLAQRPNTTLLLACRTMEKAQTAIDTIVSSSSSSSSSSSTAAKLVPLACDLADLSSIQACVQSLGATTIDTLCCNAGLARNAGATDCLRTQDGWEQSIGVNHVGHFYLQHLLLPRMNTASGKIVITASGVHDPDSPGGAQGKTATLGDLQGLETMGRGCEMLDGGAFNGDKAYKDSKLCNVMFAQELQRRLSSKDATKNISVNCFNPGLIVSTGLFRDQNPIFTKLFDFAATDLLKVGESPSWGGGCLEYMTTLETKGLYYSSPPGTNKYGDAAYGAQFCPTPISKEAQDTAKARRLWDLTSKELGIQS